MIWKESFQKFRRDLNTIPSIVLLDVVNNLILWGLLGPSLTREIYITRHSVLSLSPSTTLPISLSLLLSGMYVRNVHI